jgi:hypothetical protein
MDSLQHTISARRHIDKYIVGARIKKINGGSAHGDARNQDLGGVVRVIKGGAGVAALWRRVGRSNAKVKKGKRLIIKDQQLTAPNTLLTT